MSGPPPFLLIPASPASTRYNAFGTTAGGRVVLPAITSTTLRPPTQPTARSPSSSVHSDRDDERNSGNPSSLPLKSNPSSSSAASSSASSSPLPHHRELSFKPPTHPHSHHLHTIPPREKTTHSLIVDKLLVEHSSVLLASTRAELAWGNITSVEQESHSHEFFNGFVMEEDNDDEDGQRSTVTRRVPNTTLAQSLYAKAQGLSNVICATLSGDSTSPVPHLPNLVRFRLALSILADQLLAPPLSNPSSSPADGQTQPEIPLDLAPFVALSSFRLSGLPQPQHTTSLPGIQSFFNPPSSPSPTTSTTPKSANIFASFAAPGLSSSAGKPFFPTAPSPAPSTPTPSTPPPGTTVVTRPKSNSVTLGGFTAPPSSTPTTSEVSKTMINIPPIYSSPHPIVRSGKVPEKMSAPLLMPRTMVKPKWSSAVPTSPTSPKSSTFSASSPTSTYSSVFNTPISSSVSQILCVRHMQPTSQCTSPACHPIPRSVRSSIGAGLHSRAVSSLTLSSATLSASHPHFLTVLSNFLRLSALIMSEESEDSSDVKVTRMWYAILCELLTRCVMEGYGRCGWRGTKAAEVIFGFGGGKAISPEKDSEGGVYEPDELPSLQKAYSIIFPASTSSPQRDEFLNELKRRKSLFLSPTSSPASLSEHIANLSTSTWPIEPLEKLLIRFIQVADRWNVEDGYTEMEKYFSANLDGTTSGKRARSTSFTPPRETESSDYVDQMGRRYSSPPLRKRVAVAAV